MMLILYQYYQVALYFSYTTNTALIFAARTQEHHKGAVLSQRQGFGYKRPKDKGTTDQLIVVCFETSASTY